MLWLLLLFQLSLGDLTYCEVPEFTFKPVSGYKPVLLQMVFRHGDRSPWLTYKGDQATYDCDISQQVRFLSAQGMESYEFHHIKTEVDKEKMVFAKDNMYGGSCQMGQLTRKGLNQLATLGDKVRASYVGDNNFLPTYMNISDIYVRSTKVWRVIQSAESFLQHLYPSYSRDPDARIRVNTVPSEIEYAVYNDYGMCPREAELEKELFDKWFVDELDLRHKEPYASILAKAERFFGVCNYNWYDAYFDILQEIQCNKLEWPCIDTESGEKECFTEEEFNKLVELVYHDGVYRFFDNDTIPLARLDAGWFLRDILSFQQMKHEGKTNVKYTHFHAHDTTIYPLVSLLEGDYSSWPPYASYIIFEMYEKDSEYYIRVGYNNKLLDLNFCSKDENGMCKWKSFFDHMSKKIPKSSDCNAQNQ
ncbi:prostatic acid phosphatase precursor, putative [Entamoeba dispar SAW760]|uniref:Prostatic acid phosphatase, putative n=1 Tax=Entamoeba dispar (strain ATCC PRA-260 / SAW760) TaxID=370354 RepID=B0EAK8_ENTDS|nr:prostatic acid phosphatase precursor, putative [Entamoeba dispar SAW760]EDR28431.1 prostatic acid phosphatase precursor, putative [Entamoeba dispar SAW760]|eukprot:EDR28431.1 prostatic acid phosphatase precursor, putative [Entamoeba dispar SAW760]